MSILSAFGCGMMPPIGIDGSLLPPWAVGMFIRQNDESGQGTGIGQDHLDILGFDGNFDTPSSSTIS